MTGLAEQDDPRVRKAIEGFGEGWIIEARQIFGSRGDQLRNGFHQRFAAAVLKTVLAEPAMTNMGIIHPEPGYHERLRGLTRAAGTLLIIDETHTLSAGPGGCTAAWGLRPDAVTLGKSIGGGVPVYLDGRLIGAIAASGGTPAEDEEVARAGVEAIGGKTSMK